MKSLVIFGLIAFWSCIGYAANPAAVAAKDCQNVLNKNFNAIVYENADDLLATISPDTGTPAQFAEFRNEAETMFENTDVYMHCALFKMCAYNPPFADAWVVQQTTPKNTEDHYPLEQGKLNFRHNSALLPEHKLVVYKQRFHRKNGEWKLHLVLSEPTPVSDADLQKMQEQPTAQTAETPRCKNGKCSSPFLIAR
jgi:hypothetical protein